MRRIIKKTLAAALVATMSLSLVACGSSSESNEKKEEKKDLTEITFCLDWTPNTNHTGLYAAQALGYYEEAGLDVTFVQPPENGAELMCAAGQAQFAVAAQDTFAAVLDSDEEFGASAVAAMVQHNTSGILSRAGEGLDNPKGLEGKTYSTWESPIELAMLENVVENAGGDFSKVKLIPNDITDEPAALEAKQTDAIWVFYGWSGINADVEGVKCDYFNFSDVNEVFDYYTPMIIGNDKFMEENEEITKAFLNATQKGYEYAIENPKKAADYLIAGDSTGSLKGAEELVYASQEWLSKQYKAEAPVWGVIDEDRWNAFYGWLYENKLVGRDITGKGYNTKYLPQ